MANDHEELVALFRYSVISEAVGRYLSPTERGLVVRALASRAWASPEGEEHCYSRSTLDRWIAAYHRDGLAGLSPVRRADKGTGRVSPELMAEAVRLRRAVPTRSAAQITDIIARAHGVLLSERTVRAHLARSGVSRRELTSEPARAFGRFEASRRNEIWIGDVLIGPFVPHPRRAGSRRAKLFLLVDDHSRLLVQGRWMEEENTRAGQDVLRAAICRRGVPENLYLDNGAPYRSSQLARTCAVLGVHLVHSKPYSPAGRGKQERLNRYIRERFLAEAEAAGIKSFEELNDSFMAWAEQVANTRVHAETKTTPVARFLADGPPKRPDPSSRPRGLQVVGHPPGDKDRHGVTVRQPLRGRAIPHRSGRRAPLRSGGPRRDRRRLRRRGHLSGGPIFDRAPRASRRPPGTTTGATRTRRAGHRLPRARAPRRGTGPGLRPDRLQRSAPSRLCRRRLRERGAMSAPGGLWAAHFGFTRTPFSKSVPADKLFARSAHAEAVARIQYCIAESALGVITGEVGAGKSVAVRAAVAGLDRTRYTVVYLANPSGGCRGLYVAITTALGATPRFHKAEAIAQVANLLAAEQAERHRKVVFLIDEAHLLSPEQLEELRLLSNAEMDSASPFAGLLIGQPTLATRLRQGIFAALDQRISVRYAIGGMDLAESVGYLRHHLELVGRTDQLIADDAAARLHRYANGIPRALNNAAMAGLMAAAADGKGLVDDLCAKKAVAELTRT